MAFALNRFTYQTAGMNAGQITTAINPSTTPVLVNGPRFYSYASATDNLATISASGYFLPVIYDLAINDIIMVVADDVSSFLQVSDIDFTTSPFTITTAPFTASGTVNTANIVNGAITDAKVNSAAGIEYSKLATLNTGQVLLGDAGVPTATTLSGDATVGATGVLTIANNAVTSAKLDTHLLQYVAVPITLANFLAMYDTPVQLVAAAGANTMLLCDQVEILQTYGSAALAGGGVTAIQYDSTAHGAGVIASTTHAAADFQVTASSGYNFGKSSTVVQPFTTTVNKGLYLSCLTGDFTTGTGSTFVAHVWYRVIPTV